VREGGVERRAERLEAELVDRAPAGERRRVLEDEAQEGDLVGVVGLDRVEEDAERLEAAERTEEAREGRGRRAGRRNGVVRLAALDVPLLDPACVRGAGPLAAPRRAEREALDEGAEPALGRAPVLDEGARDEGEVADRRDLEVAVQLVLLDRVQAAAERAVGRLAFEELERVADVEREVGVGWVVVGELEDVVEGLVGQLEEQAVVVGGAAEVGLSDDPVVGLQGGFSEAWWG